MNIIFLNRLEGQPRNGSLISLSQSNDNTKTYSLTLVLTRKVLLAVVSFWM